MLYRQRLRHERIIQSIHTISDHIIPPEISISERATQTTPTGVLPHMGIHPILGPHLGPHTKHEMTQIPIFHSTTD